MFDIARDVFSAESCTKHLHLLYLIVLLSYKNNWDVWYIIVVGDSTHDEQVCFDKVTQKKTVPNAITQCGTESLF